MNAAAAARALAAFAGPAGLTDYRFPGDALVFRVLNSGLPALFGEPVVRSATELFSSRSFNLALAGLLAVLVLLRRRWAGLLPVLAGALATLSTDRFGAAVLKPWAHRLRPSFALPAGAVHQILHAANQGSMPSLHAANAFAAATAATFSWPLLGWLAFPAAVLVAASRVVGGVHWPSDIVAGALYGALLSSLAMAGLRRSHDRR